jgi:8-oxo-dGTP diphosphatase
MTMPRSASGPIITPPVRVGVATIVRRAGLVLIGRRISDSHGDGVWQFPGGHLEHGETPEACAVRETHEETGLAVRAVARGPWTNDVFAAEAMHYVTLFVLCDGDEGEARVMEPTKCAEWRWVAWDAMPRPWFLPIAGLVASGWRPAG